MDFEVQIPDNSSLLIWPDRVGDYRGLDDNIKQWLEENVGLSQSKWAFIDKLKVTPDYSFFYSLKFANPSDAVLFKLRWI